MSEQQPETERKRRWVLPVILGIAILASLFGFTIWFINERPSLTVFDSSIGCIICHRRESGKMAHPPYARAQCLSCHLKHGEKASEMLRKPLAVACFICHNKAQKQMADTYMHAPFQIGECVSCHRPHVSNEPILLKASQEDLCITCHRIAEESSLPFRHVPFVKRQCASCHSGHASEYKALARGNGKELCFNCHKKIAEKSNEKVQHEPFAGGDCMLCHRPHASVNTFLMNANTPQLCYNCHPEIRLAMAQRSHHPVPEGRMECQSCHDPHANKYDKLVSKKFERGLPGCLACHVAHGSDGVPLLKYGDINALCMSCHKTKSARAQHEWNKALGGHPVLTVRDPLRGGPLTCTSTCHKKLVFVLDSGSSDDRGMGARLQWIRKNDFCTSCHPGHDGGRLRPEDGITGHSWFHIQVYPPAEEMKKDALCLKCHPAKRLP